MNPRLSPHNKKPPRPLSQAPARPPLTGSGPRTPPPLDPSIDRSWRRTVAMASNDPQRPNSPLTPRRSARDTLLGGDPPLVAREASTAHCPRFRFVQGVDPAKHRALIVSACAEWFASSQAQDQQEGVAFLDAVIDQVNLPGLDRELLEQHGARLLDIAPAPWSDDHPFPAIAAAIEDLSHQLGPDTPAALRRLVLAFHPDARIAEALRTVRATVEDMERTAVPLSEQEALKLVQSLKRLSEEALALNREALVRTAVDLAQRVANGSAPPGQPNSPRVQALVNVVVQGLPPTLDLLVTCRLGDWLFLEIAPNAKPGKPTLVNVLVKPERVATRREAARQELLHWVHEQQTGPANALPWPDLQELIDGLAPVFQRPLSTEERLEICRNEDQHRLNPLPLLSLLYGLNEGAPADADLLDGLLERYGQPQVSSDRRSACLRGVLPLLPHPFDAPRLHRTCRRLIEQLPEGDDQRELLDQHEALIRPLQAPPSSPSAFVKRWAQDLEASPKDPRPSDRDEPHLLPDDPTAWFGPAFSPDEAKAEKAYDSLFTGPSAPFQRGPHASQFELAVHHSDELSAHAPAVATLCATWFQAGQAPRAIALLGRFLSAVHDPGVCRALLASQVSALANSPADAWAEGRGDGVLDAIRALGASGWFLADKPSHLAPASRLALLQLLGRFDPVATIGLIASELSHRLAPAPVEPPASAEGKHLIGLLGLLLRLGREQNDPAEVKLALDCAKALASACGPLPIGAAALLKARLNVLGQEAHQALTRLHIERLSDWLVLDLEFGHGQQPLRLSRVRIRREDAALRRPRDPQAAFSALIDFIDGQLAHTKGVPWAQLVNLAVTAAAALERPIDPSLWWDWCVAQAQRTGQPQALQYQLAHRQSIDSPDSPLFQDVLSVCGDPRLSEADRASLLRTACEQLQAAAASNDESDAAVRERVMEWLQAQPLQADGLPLPAVQALATALPWPLDAQQWQALCLNEARHRGRPQGLIDWLTSPPPDARQLIDRELFQDVLDLCENAPLSGGDRQRLLNAALALLNDSLRDVPLQARYADALRASLSPRQGGGYPQAYQTLFQNSPRLVTPRGDEQPDTFHLNQAVLSPGEVDALITVCDTWAQTMQMQKAQKLLDAVLRGTQDLPLHRRLLVRYADKLAALLPNATQQGQWQGILSAIAGLARQGWATAGHAHETDTTTRTVLSTLVRGIDWGQYATIELNAIEHQIQHRPTASLRGDAGRALLEQLTRLSLASIGKDDALVAQRTLRLAQALAQRLGEDHALRAPLKKLFDEVSQRWFDQARSALRPWFVLQRSTAPPSSPRAGQARLTYGWSGADKDPATPEQQANAWRALLQWARIELENPQGLAWGDMRALLEWVESAWKQPLEDRQWLALCLLEVSRTNSLSSLDQRLALRRERPLDDAMLGKLLAFASELRFPTASRAALLKHLAHHLPPYTSHPALHEDFLRTLFRWFARDVGKVLLRTYRQSPAPAGKGLAALVELVTELENEDYRSSHSAWKRFAEAPLPDATVNWDHWRRLCGQLARLMAERIQRFQTGPFPAADRQRFDDLIVQVLRRLSAHARTRESTAIDRQFELLGDLVQALPEGHRETFLHRLDATCGQHIDTALQPRDTASAPPMPIHLLALQGAARALATRHGGQATRPSATDRSSSVERAVQDFSGVFRAVLASRTGQRRSGNPDLKALRNAHRSALERGDYTSPQSPYPREVAGALLELLAHYIKQ